MEKTVLAKLVALQDKVQPQEYALQDDVCTIGRAAMCQITVEDEQSKTVSRLHIRVKRKGPRYVLYDERSANGTFVNGTQIYEPHLLSDQDAIGLGSPVPLLRFEDADPTAVVRRRLSYDEQKARFFLNNRPLDLSPAQFRLLKHLYQNVGSVCRRESCYEAMRNEAYDPDRDSDALDRAVSRLRGRLRKIDPDAGEMIKLRRGTGYELAA